MRPIQSKMARVATKLTLTQVSEAAGVSRPTVTRFENGDTVRPESIEAIKTAFEAKGVIFIDKGERIGITVAK